MSKDRLVVIGGDAADQGNVTLLYSARDVEHNNAVALRDYLIDFLLAEGAGKIRPIAEGTLAVVENNVGLG